jgi:TolB-like protein/Flp pilus assembly protein TadD
VADVFVSYARADAPLAARIAEALKAAGYEVWWDSELLPHHAFAQSIEKEVRAALAVVVVWSEPAIASQWVRAEADLARSQGKLVQVSVDGSDLPLPFNQYQTVDLRTWKGDISDPRWMKVLASVTQLTHRPVEAANAAPSFGPASALGGGARRGIILAVAAAVAFLALGGLWLAWNTFQAPARGTRIAVRPYETIGGGQPLRDFAAGLSEGLADTLNQDQLPTVSTSDAQTLQGPDLPAKLKALDVGMVLSGTVQAEGDTVTIRTHLEDPLHHAMLWTADVTGSGAGLQPLQARIGARTVAVLNCSARALDREHGIAKADVLALYLHACDLAETGHNGDQDETLAIAMLEAMRAVTRKAPNFAPGHSMLAWHAAYLDDNLPGQSAQLRREARREAERARELNPKDPDAYVALGLLTAVKDFAGRENWFRQALAVDPSSTNANGFLGRFMDKVGRIQEAAAFYQRAESVNPLSVGWSAEAAQALIWLGDTLHADLDLARLRQLWPDDVIIWNEQTQSLVAQRRWDDALAHLAELSANPALGSASALESWRAEIEAIKSHDAAALSALRQKDLGDSASDGPRAMRSLAMLGFVNDAFEVARRYQPVQLHGTDDPAYIFGPKMAAMRRDPRFMALANKWGLPQYWRATGKWPDFCADQSLSYNCQTEAAKLKAIVTLTPQSH